MTGLKEIPGNSGYFITVEGDKVLMDKYKISRRTIYDIKNNKYWK